MLIAWGRHLIKRKIICKYLNWGKLVSWWYMWRQNTVIVKESRKSSCSSTPRKKNKITSHSTFLSNIHYTNSNQQPTTIMNKNKIKLIFKILFNILLLFIFGMFGTSLFYSYTNQHDIRFSLFSLLILKEKKTNNNNEVIATVGVEKQKTEIDRKKERTHSVLF